MSIEIKQYQPSNRNAWNDFIKNSINGTIYHSLDFLDYHPKNKFSQHHLLFYKKSNLIGVLPLAIFKENGLKIAKSPYGASVGGIVHKIVKIDDALEIAKLLTDYLKKIKIARLYYTLPPFIYYKQIGHEIEFALMKQGAKIINRDLTSVISVAGKNIEEIFQTSFEKRARTAVRKAQKLNIQIKWADHLQNLEDFYRVILESKAKFKTKPTHTLEELRRIEQLCPGALKMILAYYQDRLVAGEIYLICNEQTIDSHYSCLKEKFAYLNSVNLLKYEFLKWAIKNNFKYVDYGTSSSQMEPQLGIFTFKESFGAVGIFRDTYQLDL